jgi:aspartate ammonia-lyase
MSGQETRREHDLLGERDIPREAYFGIHTLRATENFKITGQPISTCPDLIVALAAIKEAAALANHTSGRLDKDRMQAIVAACREIRAGNLHGQFVVDLIQGGAGTSTNMNANEVIANRALEILGHDRGDYDVLHPNEHVNMSQSTNDVYPTALKIAAWTGAADLDQALDVLRIAFAGKAKEFAEIVKIGRTQLQEAVPMTLGQEFGAFARMLAEDQSRLREAASLLCEINMGATAIGTGINAPPGYASLVRTHICEITGAPVTTAVDLIEATQECGAFVHLSGVLKRIAVKVSKICNDLRLLSSGPRAGFGEITLPARQAGSSIMPGKINPVIPELVNQVAFEVIGNDVTISFAAEAGQLQLNAFEPIIAYSLFNSLRHLRAACISLADNCVRDIRANREVMRASIERSIGVATALNPHIGYAAATAVASEALATGRGVYEIVLEKQLLGRETLDRLLNPDLQALADLSLEETQDA